MADRQAMFRALMEAAGSPENAVAAIAHRRNPRGAGDPGLDRLLGTQGAAPNDPRLAEFDRYTEGVVEGQGLPGGDALAPLGIAAMGLGAAGYEGLKGLGGTGLLAGISRDFEADETTSPASLDNVMAFISGLKEGSIYQRGEVEPLPREAQPSPPPESLAPASFRAPLRLGRLSDYIPILGRWSPRMETEDIASESGRPLRGRSY